MFSLNFTRFSHKPLKASCNPTNSEFFPVIFQIWRCWQLCYMRLFEGSVENCFSSGCFTGFTHSHYRLSGICQPGVGSQRMEIQRLWACNKLPGRAPAVRSALSLYSATHDQMPKESGRLFLKTNSSVCICSVVRMQKNCRRCLRPPTKLSNLSLKSIELYFHSLPPTFSR